MSYITNYISNIYVGNSINVNHSDNRLLAGFYLYDQLVNSEKWKTKPLFIDRNTLFSIEKKYFSNMESDAFDRFFLKTGVHYFVNYHPNKLLIETEVLESEVGKLRIGQKADLQTIANPYKTYNATLTEINPSVDTETGMLKIKLAIDNSQGLLPGMNASVRIKVPYNTHLIIAKEAVVLRSGKSVVFTMEDNLAKWNYVTLGNENGEEVEVLEGLNGGQQVIISNNLQLAHDTPVKVNNPTKIN